MTQATELRELASLIHVDGSNSYVGVSSTSFTPGNILHVKSSVNNGAVITLESTATDSYPFLRLKNDAREYQITNHGPLGDKFTIYDGTAGSHRFTIDNTGKVGIGNQAPDHQLDVEGGNNVFDLARFGSSSSDNSEVTIGYFDANATNGIPALITASDFGGLIQGGEHGHLVLGIRDNDSTDALDIVSGGGNFMTDSTYDTLVATFRANGNVGIGHNAPTHTLHVDTSATGVYIQRELTSNAANLTEFNGNRSLIIKNRAGGSFLMFGGNGSRTDIQATDGASTPTAKNIALNPFGGNVGIGTDSPTTELEVAGTALVENTKLKAIAQSNTDTAVDVFVYDTRKDSDGGAWRKRTQNTSWYNETLNTSTRGARKEFPSVAVIVAESGQVTIYDGDDPDMPMWMTFNGGADNTMLGSTQTAAVVRNGALWVALNGYGVSEINFIKDEAWRHRNNVGSNYYGKFNGDIIDRNTGGTFSKSDYIGALVNGLCNDIAITVLPNAPIDTDTGLPVPTIAVATDGGVSVIKDDGTVIDYTGNAPYNIATLVNFTKDHRIRFALESGSGRYYRTYNIGYVDRSVNQWDPTQDDGLTLYTNYANGDAVMLGNPIKDATEKAVSTNSGVTFFEENLAVANKSLVAHTTSSYATGWMNGNIKLATLSDTDTTNAVGTELLVNNLTANVTGWASPGGTIVWNASGYADVTRGASDGPYVASYPLSTTLTVGEVYTVTANIVTNNGGGNSVVRFGSSTIYTQDTNIKSGTGILSGTFIASAAHTHIWLYSLPNNTTSFKEVYVRKAEEDRSVNGNGLQVFGTVTKTAVATGAELVGYTPSGTSYLRQPSAGGLALTSDFSITWWQKYDTSGGTYEGWQIVEDDTSSASHYDKVVLSAMHEISSSQYLIRGDNITASGVNNGIAGGSWTCMTVTKTGGKIKLYTNGKLSSTTAGTCSTPSNPYSLEILRWKYANSSYYANDSALALFRTSNTVPTAEQIAKIYEDEKVLFQENAKATLYGSSDAVTALAYDDDTELLHVGTNAGRSEFQGLRRVNNTTDAVGSAISASNGFIVED